MSQIPRAKEVTILRSTLFQERVKQYNFTMLEGMKWEQCRRLTSLWQLLWNKFSPHKLLFESLNGFHVIQDASRGRNKPWESLSSCKEFINELIKGLNLQVNTQISNLPKYQTCSWPLLPVIWSCEKGEQVRINRLARNKIKLNWLIRT